MRGAGEESGASFFWRGYISSRSGTFGVPRRRKIAGQRGGFYLVGKPLPERLELFHIAFLACVSTFELGGLRTGGEGGKIVRAGRLLCH